MYSKRPFASVRVQFVSRWPSIGMSSSRAYLIGLPEAASTTVPAMRAVPAVITPEVALKSPGEGAAFRGDAGAGAALVVAIGGVYTMSMADNSRPARTRSGLASSSVALDG